MGQTNVDKARLNMIEQQVRPWDVFDDRVLEAMASTPRERFVSEQYCNLAFSDLELPIGNNETMLAPKIEGRILQALNIQPNESILEIGTGSGYLTACMAKLGKHVDTIDIHSDASNAARQLLTGLSIENVKFMTGDAFSEIDSHQHYDIVVMTGSLPMEHPMFRDMLNIGGRLFMVTGEDPLMDAQLITRTGENEWECEHLFTTSLPELHGCQRREAFRF